MVAVTRLLPFIATILLTSTNALAQTLVAAQPARGGFTFLVNLGVGVQRDSGFENTAVGWAGLNIGVGGFLNEKMAALFRTSGTNVVHSVGGLGEARQTSGVAAGSLQYWISDRFTIEGGLGLGFWRIEDETERGLGAIVGAGAVLLNRGRHNVLANVEYVPAFTDPAAVHNLGFTIGYQYHR